VAVPRCADIAAALWTVHAHALEAAGASPLLTLTSPEKRCGKTTMLLLLARLVPRALLSSNISPASLFRIVERYSPTLLVDEADSFLRDNEELRGILNSGHTRDAAFVVRTVGDEHEPRRFSTWAPKAVALIGRLQSNVVNGLDDSAIRHKGGESGGVTARENGANPYGTGVVTDVTDRDPDARRGGDAGGAAAGDREVFDL
jgi:hypothetical protein